VKPIALLLALAVVAGCESADVPDARPGGPGLVMTCSMTRLDLQTGDELPPPVVSITNRTDRPVDLIGPTLTVVSCTLVEPRGGLVELRLAMPTGRDPADMPRTRLRPGASIRLTPGGIWYYGEGVGYEPYVFEHPGEYELRCRYEDVASNTLTLNVRGRPFDAGARRGR
jgi:hypothetical protein